jgi:hypothetical protein
MQAALVRPDRHLFGGGTLAGLPALLQQVLTMPLSPAQVAV